MTQETKKEFKVGDFWMDAHRNKYMVVEVLEDILRVYSYTSKTLVTLNYEGVLGSLVLTEPWREPITGTVWVNVYPNNNFTIHDKKESAAIAAWGDRIACVKVPYTEGEFHE